MDVLTPAQLPDAARFLAAGQMVAVPTPRWYMLCARAADPAATNAVFRAKQRPGTKPLLFLLDSSATAETLFDLSDDARLLVGGLWPGDLALRLPWVPDVEPVAAVGSPALVGCPGGVLGQLVALAGEPLAAAVCSISTPAAGDEDHPALTAGQVVGFDRTTGAGIAAVVDGGICPHGRHMTIVDCPAGAAARLHREGTVHARAVEAALAPAGGPHVG
ncbi:L-threonylcarbamoyladenylate synthase [Streptomyces olivochromogenes]|uniref:L-threonylcarbamoyladenylate synthase n=1 Tax=Streptomyces olivochromogenes TaxID=1963 RepID=A0A250VRW7_STROL|nr:Sua5/YciO/YrdC/YwlC family protein [Streptomyces olivochromogenes]KUN38714.1 translation factor SUA5 [Streptomyces olivochromogenes]GAX56710.1 threonylcarbamoyl-AMP synthase [Streptomyces olivochromogenes]